MRDHVKALFGRVLLSCLAAGLLPPDVVPAAVGQTLSGQDARIVTFKQSADKVEAYDFLEVTASVARPTAKNPFTDVALSGQFQREGAEPVKVQGFCDSSDGSKYRIRFMPSKPGKYSYSTTIRLRDASQTHTGTFEATDGKRRGVLRVDKDYPCHFVWEGTGEHYFFNGNTAFLLMGWQDEAIIRGSLDRQARLKVNRLRVLLGGGRSSSFWGEPIIPSKEFQVCLNPWVAQQPNDITTPKFDYTRFNIGHWQKFERLLRFARDRGLVISVVFDWNDSPVHPAESSKDERRYFHYAADRLSAFANVTWDLGDDISAYRTLEWSRKTGSLLYERDPYHHLATDHPIDNKHQDRTSAWFGFTSFQEWSRPQHDWMLNQRQAQKKTGRIIPRRPTRSTDTRTIIPGGRRTTPMGPHADNMRRTAWEIYMAGCYQTTGETCSPRHWLLARHRRRSG